MPDNSWTRDSEGNFVVWNRPPHYQRGVVSLVLPGERNVSEVELAKRREEFVKLQRRDLRRKTNDASLP